MKSLSGERIEGIKAEKERIRRMVLSRRKSENPARLEPLSRVICTSLESHPLWQRSGFPFIYVSSKPGEVDTRGLIRRALDSGKRVCVPAVESGTGKLLVCEIKGIEGLIPGIYGILEPPPENRSLVAQGRWDLAVVPGVAFDRERRRIGFGKGYYDRVLEGAEVPKIGLAFSFQIVEPFETLPHDIDMDLVLTENETIS